MARSRASSLRDLDDICIALPEVERSTAWGGLPAFKVHGHSFVVFRGPRPDAIDPATGEPMDDVIVVTTQGQEDKLALVEADGPFFTTPHFDGHDAVLVRERDLPRVNLAELTEILTDAWLARAPKRLANAYLEGH
ncbi:MULTISPECIES: MmcQ/YjbR family DNA-binding protein [unclassified Janibacter]|uniref:MmcQ/YjbR family DNA-binding protein n=1 Tax=unclassified Janibacter TaxID=2649294 RepID=UPI003CFE4EE3